ncbi:MAG: hypothetical protein ACKOYN_13075 [Planctomycetota bacterium]
MRPIHAIIDLLVILVVAAGLGVALHMYQEDLEHKSAVESTQAALVSIEAELGIRAALADARLNEFGHLPQVDRDWFSGLEPRNALAPANAPWIDIATDAETEREHPRNPTFHGGRSASFWYNPAKGIVRARVPDQVSDAAARELYAQINGITWR